eukprot:scaffold32080_cov61-Isochrysis_galbana.AAC.1
MGETPSVRLARFVVAWLRGGWVGQVHEWRRGKTTQRALLPPGGSVLMRACVLFSPRGRRRGSCSSSVLPRFTRGGARAACAWCPSVPGGKGEGRRPGCTP